MQKLSKT